MEKGIWQEIEELYQEFRELGISQSVDYEKYYLYSLITHSTAIEGSTLTEMETQLKKSLSLEIERYNASRQRGFSFMF